VVFQGKTLRNLMRGGATFVGNITRAHEIMISKNTVLDLTTADITGLRIKQVFLQVITSRMTVHVPRHSVNKF